MNEMTCLKHRAGMYYRGLDMLIEGKGDPGHVHARWQKFKKKRKQITKR